MFGERGRGRRNIYCIVLLLLSIIAKNRQDKVQEAIKLKLLEIFAESKAPAYLTNYGNIKFHTNTRC